jgi:hypothetical protein
MKQKREISFESLVKTASRLTTAVLLFVIVWGCSMVPTLKEGSEGAYVRLPFVRVLLGVPLP